MERGPNLGGLKGPSVNLGVTGHKRRVCVKTKGQRRN